VQVNHAGLTADLRSFRGRLAGARLRAARSVQAETGAGKAAAKAAGVSLSTAYQWKAEFDAEPRD